MPSVVQQHYPHMQIMLAQALLRSRARITRRLPPIHLNGSSTQSGTTVRACLPMGHQAALLRPYKVMFRTMSSGGQQVRIRGHQLAHLTKRHRLQHLRKQNRMS